MGGFSKTLKKNMEASDKARAKKYGLTVAQVRAARKKDADKIKKAAAAMKKKKAAAKRKKK